MKKIDFKKELKHLYKAPAKEAVFVEVPKMNYLVIEGKGNPNTSDAYKNAVETLYMVSYALKFMVKKGGMEIDYGVMPLEGLWWVDEMTEFDINKKDDWLWKSMILQPEFITDEMVSQAIEQVKTKKNPIALPKLKFESFEDGKSAQIMHVGPFTEEGPTVDKLHQFISDNNKSLNGKHHEIYLSDIRRAVPEKWKTIIRQPIV